MLKSIVFGLIIFVGTVVGFVCRMTLRLLVRTVGKERMIRLLCSLMNDARTQHFLVEAGAASALLQFQGLLAQIRITQDAEEPEAITEAVEPEPPIQSLWPAELPPPPPSWLIAEVVQGMRAAGPDIEDWRFATSEAFLHSGGMLMLTEGCADWARMAKERKMPPEVVKTSFVGGVALLAFQLGLIVAQYEHVDDGPESPDGPMEAAC